MSPRFMIGAFVVSAIVGFGMVPNGSDAGETAIPAATLQTAALDPATALSKRQALMKELGGHMKAINEFLEQGTGSAADVATRAAAIKTASAQIPELFPEGTSIDDNVGKTAAKADIWARFDEFKTDATRMGDEAGKLAEAAATDDRAAIGAQFAALGKDGCGGCHSVFRQKLD